MKRLLTSAATAAMLVAGTGGTAQAQMEGAPLFDLGLYGGLGYSSSWFEINDEGYRPGFGPVFGAAATFWGLPFAGVRAHFGYMPSGFPEPDDLSIGEKDSNYPLNNYMADLNLVFRPFAGPVLGVFAAPYVFVGGGAMWTNVAGTGGVPEGQVTCVPQRVADPYARNGVCLSYQPSYATVGQGVAGLGFDVLSLAANIGVFGELAAHVYDSPAHVDDNSTTADDKYVFNPTAKLGLKFAFGEPAMAPVVVPPAPAPLPPPPPPAAPTMTPIRVCVVEGGQLRDVEAQFNPATGDTMTTAGGRFSMTYPATAPNYAGGETWFINNDSVTFNNRQYVKFGTTRIITPASLTSGGTVNGVTVFTETGAAMPADVIYVPVRPGCEFQPYQQRQRVRVRG